MFRPYHYLKKKKPNDLVAGRIRVLHLNNKEIAHAHLNSLFRGSIESSNKNDVIQVSLQEMSNIQSQTKFSQNSILLLLDASMANS